MRPKCFITALLVWLLGCSHLFANGGPVEECYLYATGNIKPLAKKDISLKKEKLDIRLEGDYAYVDVLYTFYNSGAKDEVTYAFPVDYLNPYAEGILQEDQNSFQDLRMADEKGSISTTRQARNENYKIKAQNDLHDIVTGQEVEVIRTWYTGTITFDSKAEKQLLVSYKVKNSFSDWGTSKEFYLSYSSRIFTYDFKMGSYWGNGIVPELDIIIDARGLHNTGDRVIGIGGYEANNTGGLYTYFTKNFDLKTAKPLVVEYDNSGGKMEEFLAKFRIGQENITSVAASSTLPGNTYEVGNLFDGNPETAWVEGKKGVGAGEAIEIFLHLKQNKRIAAIGIRSGYQKSDETYRNNGMPKKIRIDYHSINPDDQKYLIADTVTLARTRSFQTLADFGEIGYQFDRITITILDAWEGEKYDDTCISELYLLGYEY